MKRRSGILTLLVAGATLLGAPLAHAINHTSDYKTNMQNYRTCTDPLLSTCAFPDVISPSKFYLAAVYTTTVIHKDDGTVQLRIDAGGIATDTDVSYPCQDEVFPCNGTTCTAGPRQGSGCTINRCIGGSNNGGVCSTSSACPGGSCTGGASCVAPTCQGGPRDNKECAGTQPACTSVASTAGWSVVFRGNRTGFSFTPSPPWYHYQLKGDDSSGCMKVCPFSLDSTGAINSAGLTCTTSGDCGSSGPDVFHAVELRDLDDELLAIPGIGGATVDNIGVEGDPAKAGDCVRDPNRSVCQ
jgi:hypothetical protein